MLAVAYKEFEERVGAITKARGREAGNDTQGR